MQTDGSLIVSGIPGAGKTTIARALAERVPMAAHLEQDAIYNLVVAGHIAKNDLSRPGRIEYAARHKQVAAQWTYLAEPMVRDLTGVGLWLDTSELDVEGTLDAISSRWNEALLVESEPSE